MPYRDLDLPPTAPPPPALQWAARLVGIQALANIALAGAMRWVESLADEEILGRAKSAYRWLSVMDDPAWWLAPWVLLALVSVGAALVVLRGQTGTRWLGLLSAAIGLVTALFMLGSLTGYGGAWFMRIAPAGTLLATIPVLWAVSRPNARTLVWLATATAFAGALVPAVRLVRPQAYRSFFDGALSEAALSLGSRISFALAFVTAAVVAVAGFVRRPEDARGPAPDAPMSRSAVAMFLAASIPSALAIVRAVIALQDSPLTRLKRSGCGTAASYAVPNEAFRDLRMSDFPDLTNWFVLAGFAALVATFVAARKLTSTTALLVAAAGAMELGYFWLARPGSFWGVGFGTLVVLATFVVQAAKERSLEATNALAHGDRKPAADRIARTANALTACSVPAIGAAFVAVAVDLAPVPSKGLAYGAAFLGVAALVLLALAARVYRRNAWLFSELARMST